MEELKKSQNELLQERVEKLEQENESLKKEKEMYEEWLRKTDARNLELIEGMKSIGTIAGIISNHAKY